MTRLGVFDTAFLIGFTPEHLCVYGAQIPLHEYWDGEHPWDDGDQIKALRLATVRGYLFGPDGQLIQEFESRFNFDTAKYLGGWTRSEDGKLTEDGP